MPNVSPQRVACPEHVEGPTLVRQVRHLSFAKPVHFAKPKQNIWGQRELFLGNLRTDDYLEILRQSGLPQHRIRRMPGLDLAIDDKMHLRNRTAPNLVIAFACTRKDTPCGKQQPFELRCKTFHQAASSKRRVSNSNAMGANRI